MISTDNLQFNTFLIEFISYHVTFYKFDSMQSLAGGLKLYLEYPEIDLEKTDSVHKDLNHILEVHMMKNQHPFMQSLSYAMFGIQLEVNRVIKG